MLLLPIIIHSGEINYTPIPVSAEQKIKITFGEHSDRMIKIAKCESGLRQFDTKGKTIISKTNDYGLFQINEGSWDKTAQQMGLDYKGSETDNVLLAKHILDVQGFDAWVCNSKI